MFLGSAVSVSKQVGISSVLISMFLGSTVSASEQMSMSAVLIMFLGSDWITCRLLIIFQANSIKW